MAKGSPIPVVITIYRTKSWLGIRTFTPPVSYFIKKAAKLESGSKTGNQRRRQSPRRR